MNKTVRLINIGLMMLVLCSSTFTAIDVCELSDIYNKSVFDNNNDAELPIWTIGDKWVYDAEIQANQGEGVILDLSINNLELELMEVSDKIYNLSLEVGRGSLTGSGVINFDILTLSGNLINTQMGGYVLINKSTLEMIEVALSIDGYVDKAIDIPFSVQINLKFYDETWNFTNFTSLRFPMNVGDNWNVPYTYSFINTEFSLIPSPSKVFPFMDTHSMYCSEWDIIKIANIEYDVLRIIRDYSNSNIVYYSPMIGNILKLDYSNLDFGYDFAISKLDMTLVSTTFQSDSDPPSKPMFINGPTNLIAGESGEFETSATDPDDDKIRYIFHWGDGTKTSSGFLLSGETAFVSHFWDSKGIYDVKVKSRDTFGKESDWSDEITVTVTNEPPMKPQTPQGKSKVDVRETHSYSTSSVDPDGHDIKYLFDWGDGTRSETDFANSGDIAYGAHKWDSQDVYQIKVMAVDRYGEMSEWSDPVTVAVPKYLDLSSYNKIIFRFFQIIMDIIY
jgi:hypothetical protein